MGIDELLGLVLLIAGGVEVRGLGGKLGSAGIDHLEAADIVVHRQLFGTGQAQDGFIQEAVMLGLQILFAGQGAVFRPSSRFARCCILSRNHQSILVMS